MRYLLDANIVILFLTGTSPSLFDRFGACAEGDVATSAIAFAEVMLGSTSGRPPSVEALNAFCSYVALLPFDEAAARAYAQLPFRRGSFDRLIAAHAIAAGLTLVTANGRDFADISDLRIEDWTA